MARWYFCAIADQSRQPIHGEQEQVGQGGMGSPSGPMGPTALMDEWLVVAGGVAEETEAAARPTNTTNMTKARITSFILVTSFDCKLTGDVSPDLREWYSKAIDKSSFFFWIHT